MQAAGDGTVSVTSWATLSLQNCPRRSCLKGYEEEMVGFRKARESENSQEESWWKFLRCENGLAKSYFKPSCTETLRKSEAELKFDTVPRRLQPHLKAAERGVGEDHRWRGLALERNNEICSACGDLKLTSWHLWGNVWNVDKNFSMMGKRQSVNFSDVSVGKQTEFVFVEDKRRRRTEDLSQIAAESTNGTWGRQAEKRGRQSHGRIQFLTKLCWR